MFDYLLWSYGCPHFERGYAHDRARSYPETPSRWPAAISHAFAPPKILGQFRFFEIPISRTWRKTRIDGQLEHLRCGVAVLEGEADVPRDEAGFGVIRIASIKCS